MTKWFFKQLISFWFMLNTMFTKDIKTKEVKNEEHNIRVDKETLEVTDKSDTKRDIVLMPNVGLPRKKNRTKNRVRANS